MVPVIVEVTVRVEIIATNAPAGALAVTNALSKGLEASNSALLVRGKFKVLTYEKPD